MRGVIGLNLSCNALHRNLIAPQSRQKNLRACSASTRALHVPKMTRWKRLIPESELPYWHFILWFYSCICIYNLDRNMRITAAPSFLHSAQGCSVSLGRCNATESKKHKDILQSTAAINIIYFLTSLTVWVACMICIALLQFTSLRQHCDCGRAMRIFSCGGLFRGSLFCWGGLSSSRDEQIQAEWKVQLESRRWKNSTKKQSVKTLMDKLVLSILKQTAS